MNTVPRKIKEVKEEIYFDPYGKVRDLKLQIDDWLDKHGPNVFLDYETYTDSCEVNYFIVYDRLETDEEYNKRLKTLAATEARKAQAKADKPKKEAEKRKQLEKDCRELAAQLGFDLVERKN